MWVKRSEFVTLATGVVAAQTKAAVLEQQNAVLQTTMDWQRVRLHQLEIERANLLFSMTGVRVPVPIVEAAAVEDPLRNAALFEDMGDEEAKRQGIDWDALGQIIRK
jgi:hypothetical protein